MMLSEDLFLILSECWILGMAVFILLLGVFRKSETDKQSATNKKAGTDRIIYFTSLFTLLIAGILTWQTFEVISIAAFHQSYIIDNLSQTLKLAIYIFGFLVFLSSQKYLRDQALVSGEYYALCLFSILGMMVLVSSGNLLTLYLGIELLTLPLYALIAISRNRLGSEAAMKYFVMGALASGMLLYGISLLYGATASLNFQEISNQVSSLEWTSCCSKIQIPILFSLVLILIGLIFKFGAVPFHMWIPDVYQGAPSSVTLFIGTLPKIAAFGFAIRILVNLFSGLTVYWQKIFILVALLSLGLGNIIAIAQTNLKRMLGYSTIGHLGFVILALLAGPSSGYAAGLFYVLVYSIMAWSAFSIIIYLSHQGFEAENLADYRGLGRSQPMVAFLMLLIMFSLAGVPPMLGFYAKYFVLLALVEAGWTSLAVVALLFTVIAAFYYLRIVKLMYFDTTVSAEWPDWHTVSRSEMSVLSLSGLFILGLGIYPAPLINFCMALFRR